MKKFCMTFLVLVFMFLVTGCDGEEQKLVCISVENDDGMSIEQVISMTYTDDKLTHMTMEVNTKVTDSNVQENWEGFKQMMDEDNEEFNQDGVRLTTEVNDQSYEYKTILDIDVLNASEEALNEYGFSDLKDDDSTLESSKEEAEKDGATCEIK